jgi:two-component system response regulator FixJ
MAGGDRKNIFFFGRDLQPRTAWESILRRYSASLGRFTKPAACLDELSRRPCDLLVVDFEGGATEALELLAGVGRVCPRVASLALVDHGDIPAAVEAVKAGAVDCLERPIEPDRLLAAVETALGRPRAPASLRVCLTPTETQVLHLILAGKTSQDVADALHRSKRTIEVHRRNIMHKLGVSNAAALVREAAASGLLDRTME